MNFWQVIVTLKFATQISPLLIYLFGREHGRELVFTDVECFKCIDHNNVK